VSVPLLILNLAILGLVLRTGLGTHRLTARRTTLPLLVAIACGFFFLRGSPTAGHDVGFAAVGAAAGLVLGVIAGLLVRTWREDGRVMTGASTAYAALWIVVIGGRIAFAYGADHVFAPEVARFSRTHQITGSDAWTTMFVLMALSMIAARIIVTLVRAAVISRDSRRT
jgi:hypothetical protein